MDLKNVNEAFVVIRDLKTTSNNIGALGKIRGRESNFNMFIEHTSDCVNENVIIRLDEDLLNVIVEHLKTKEVELMTELELM